VAKPAVILVRLTFIIWRPEITSDQVQTPLIAESHVLRWLASTLTVIPRPGGPFSRVVMEYLEVTLAGLVENVTR